MRGPTASETRTRERVAYTPDPALSFWPTPYDVADDLVYLLLQPWHHLGEGVRVLEPSAGEGHLARAIRHHLPRAHITAVEPSHTRAESLRRLAATPPPHRFPPGHNLPSAYWPRPRPVVDEVVESTLENYLANVALTAFTGEWQPYHLVVMNPPFTLKGRPEAWAEHVLAIYHDPYLLTPGGVLGAVVPHVVKGGQSKKVRAIRELLHPHYGIEECQRGAMAPVGAKVSAALIFAEKTVDPADET